MLKSGGYFLYADFRQDSNIADWRRTLNDSGLRLIREDDITPHVLSALDRDNERKTALIQKLVPRPLQRTFSGFAALRGSEIYEAFRSRKLVYICFVLRKNPVT